ncbi:MAG: FkbM family methyltransferase [Alphaproteobacteria bacterium]|nr:FkbM family methyltransferase [Alphaproteobacteria bacterium]
MLNYIKKSIQRKIARRITKEYGHVIDTFHLKSCGDIEFANWKNPLVTPVKIDDAMVAFFQQFIKPGDLVIDIGSNIGDTTVPMAICAGKSGCTLGFDPNPFVYNILKVNASLNQDKTAIFPINMAITDQEEAFYFISSEASFGNGGISKTKDSIHGNFVLENKIKGVPLKPYLETHFPDKLSKLTFIKIDAEGYDKDIIKSIQELILLYKPTIIAECFVNHNHQEKTELYDILKSFNYDIFYFEDFKIDAAVKHLQKVDDLLKYKDTINIYALPKR